MPTSDSRRGGVRVGAKRGRVTRQGVIRIATRDDGGAVEALRIEAYRSSPDFRMGRGDFLERLRWGKEDEEGVVLTVWSSGKLVATMRAELIESRADAARHFAGALPPADHAQWPMPVLSRAATCGELRRSGLNSLMRLYFLRAAAADRARRVYGYVAMGGERTRLMASLGYEFSPRQDQDPETPSPRRWALAWLDVPMRGGEAVRRLELWVNAERAAFPWAGPTLKGLGRTRSATRPQ